jgi:hypothetical protein
MNIDLAEKKVTVKDITTEVIVPGNPKAKLMYYLECISVVLNTDKLNRYTNYSQYYIIPDSEISTIVELAKIFNPEEMLKLGIFILKDYIYLGNTFLEITDETMGIHANQEFVIGGIVVRVLKIMLCTKDWIQTYYYEPIVNIFKPNIYFPAPSKFGSSPVAMFCPFCQKPITTVTKSSFNFVACCCFLFFGLLFFICQAILRKNICCCDIIHKCPRCGRTLGSYKSC